MKRIPLLLSFLLTAIFAYADNISEQQAYSIAVAFAKSHNMKESVQQPKMAAKRSNKSQTSSNAAYYVFNMGDKNDGFVIVSGNDSSQPVLGYSTEGSFDEANMPEELNAMLEANASNTYSSIAGSLTRASAPSRAAISPMIQTKWGVMTPEEDNSSSAYQYCGTSAVALAQLLYYYREKIDTVMPIYSTMYRDTLPGTSFNWGIMPLECDTADADAGSKEVGRLIDYSLYALTVTSRAYGITISDNAHVWPKELHDYFGFSPLMRVAFHSNYESDTWNDLVHSELQAGRPVLYSGGGRQFLCDGYDGNGYFHINWGWKGKYDGYYLMSTAQPQDETGLYGEQFNGGQHIICYARPAEVGDSALVNLNLLNITTSDTTATRTSTEEQFSSIKVSSYFDAPFPDGQYTYALYKGDTFMRLLHEGERVNKDAITANSIYSYNFHSYVSNWDFTSVEDGDYRIVPVYKAVDSTSFKPCTNSDVHYLTAKLSENTLSLHTVNTVSQGEGIYTVSNMYFENEDVIKDKENVLHFTVTNSGTAGSEVALRVQIQANYQSNRRNNYFSVIVAPGDSTEVKMPYTFQHADNIHIYIYVNGDRLNSGNFSVLTAPDANLEGRYYFNNWRKGDDGTLTLPANIIVTNLRDVEYDDSLFVKLLPGIGYETKKDTTIALKVPGNGTVTVPLVFEGLNASANSYLLQTYYRKQGKKTSLTDLDLTRVYIAYDISSNWLDAPAKEKKTISSVPQTVTFIIENKGSNDFNNTITVSAYLDKDGEKYNTQSIDTAVTIPAYGSIDFVYNWNTLLVRDSGEYVVSFDYKDANYEGSQKTVEAARFTKLASTDEASLTGICTYGKLTNDPTLGPTIPLMLTIENSGNAEYNDSLLVEYYPLTFGRYLWEKGKELTTTVTVSANDSLTQQITLEGIDTTMVRYDLYIYYKKGDEWEYLTGDYVDLYPEVIYAAANFDGQLAVKVRKDSDGTLSMPGVLTVTNLLDTEYRGKVNVELDTTRTGERILDWYMDKTIDVTIPAHGTVNLPFSFDNLELSDNADCNISAYYFDKDTVKIMAASSFPLSSNRSFYQHLEVSSHTYDSASKTATLTFRNVDGNTFGDYVYMSVAYLSEDKSGVEVYTDSTWIFLQRGDSVTVNYDFHRLTAPGEYRASYCYYSNNRLQEIAEKIYFTIPNAYSKIDVIGISGNALVKVYYLSGRYIGTMPADELKTRLKKGIYIVNGKKVVVR